MRTESFLRRGTYPGYPLSTALQMVYIVGHLLLLIKMYIVAARA